MLLRLCLGFIGLWLVAFCAVAQTYDVQDIRIEGLQRVTAGQVFNVLQVQLGDSLQQKDIAELAHQIFSMGSFSDVKIGWDEGTLVLMVDERPSIWNVNIDGNEDIPDEALLDALTKSGLSQGSVFKRGTLNQIEAELRRQYVVRGYYNVIIGSEIQPVPLNRVNVTLKITEGKITRVERINIIGNENFTEEELLDNFQSRQEGVFSFLARGDQYIRERFAGDLERLTSFYQDKGYSGFNIKSVLVAMTPEKDAVYITVNVDEGKQFTIGEVQLTGNIPKALEAPLRNLIPLKAGTPFSQRRVAAIETFLSQYLSQQGYIFARVVTRPENLEDNTVELSFIVDSGKLIYTRRVNFVGNTRTADRVLRQEVRQLEGSPASLQNIEISRVRLQRLGFFKGVEVQNQPVPGREDLVDFNFIVEEQPTSSISASIGYSDDAGLSAGIRLDNRNFRGSGRTLDVGINTNQYQEQYYLNFLEPYFTEYGVSRGFNLFYRKTDLDEVTISNYTIDSLGAVLRVGYPINETQRLDFGIGFTQSKLSIGSSASQEIIASPRLYPGVSRIYNQDGASVDFDVDGDVVNRTYSYYLLGDPTRTDFVHRGFIDEYGENLSYFTLNIGWRQVALNRGLLPTAGYSQAINTEITAPGSELEYYKLFYEGEQFFDLGNESLVLRLRAKLAYGDGYGDTKELPFFQNFFSGGLNSVRGFERSSLGPRTTPAYIYGLQVNPLTLTSFIYILDSEAEGEERLQAIEVGDPEGDPIGGNFLVEGSFELLFRLPIVEDDRLLRTAFFVDFGNVFNTDCKEWQRNCLEFDMSDLRYSVGVGLTWVNAFAPLSFSYAETFNEGPYDEIEHFQFTLGTTF